MAVGLPSVSRKCHDGIADLVQDGVNGYLVEMEDKDGFVERAVELANDAKRREAISEKAKMVSITFGLETVTDIWERMITN